VNEGPRNLDELRAWDLYLSGVARPISYYDPEEAARQTADVARGADLLLAERRKRVAAMVVK